MYKRVIIILVLIFSLFLAPSVLGGSCTFDGDYKNSLNSCLSDSNLVEVTNAKVEDGFKKKIINWTKTIAGVFLLFAVGSIVYGGGMMTLSGGVEDKIKKGKDIVKWGIGGALAIVGSATVITIIIEVMFSIKT